MLSGGAKKQAFDAITAKLQSLRTHHCGHDDGKMVWCGMNRTMEPRHIPGLVESSRCGADMVQRRPYSDAAPRRCSAGGAPMRCETVKHASSSSLTNSLCRALPKNSL